MNLKSWICLLLLATVLVAPVFARANDDTRDKNSPPANTANSNEPAAVPTAPIASPSPTTALNAKVTALLDALVKKGVLAPAEASVIRNASPEAEFQLLVDALNRKGLIDAADLSPAVPPTAQPMAQPRAIAAAPAADANPAGIPLSTPDAEYPSPTSAAPYSAEAAQAAGPAVVPAVTPVRVLGFDSPKAGGLLGLKLGPVTFTPYGFIKATAEHDTSSPNGDDFPTPGGLMLLPGTNIGPDSDPEYHMKARGSRVGINLEWPDITSKLALTGRFEADFEGNFNESDNADVTSIRNPNPRLRLAYVRMDYNYSDRTSFFFVGGQDWTLFGSKALPNVLDTTWVDADFGAIYNRTPQFRFGMDQELGESSRHFKISPEFAVQMPASGQVEKLTFCTLAGILCPPLVSQTAGFLSQIGEAEREGADSDKPEIAAGLTLQFQLDKAPAVAPAQIFWTGFFGERTSIVPNSGTSAVDLLGAPYPTALVAGTPLANGFKATSDMYGNQIGVQLPTRWATLVVSLYRGGDLREVLGGQLTTDYTNMSGLVPMFYGTGTDNVAGTLSGFAELGCTGTGTYYVPAVPAHLTAAGVPVAATAAVPQTCSGTVVVAPQHGVRAYGGFIELGLPLSRWFNADPKGHNAGWQLYLRAGKDQLVHRDALAQLGFVNGIGPNQTGQALGIPILRSSVAQATLFYRFNRWCTFGFEQSYYNSRAIPELNSPVGFWTIGARPTRTWQNERTEVGPVFTF